VVACAQYVILRWYAAFFIAAFTALPVALLFWQPLDLTLTEVRLERSVALEAAALLLLALAILGWVSAELARTPVQTVIANAGFKRTRVRMAAVAGVSVVVLASAFAIFMLSGERARTATSIAAQRVGPGYRFHAVSINVATAGQHTSVSAIVIAWDQREIRRIPVHWEE